MRALASAAALVLGLVVLGLAGHAGADPAGGSAPPQTDVPAVLELFTSQGCSSCPPADALFRRYAGREDIIALTTPVDYWDSLGWKDTFAKHEYTNRQRAYAAYRGDGSIYTPQVVVNGRTHAVGSSQTGIEGAMAATAGMYRKTFVPLRVRREPDGFVVEAGRAPAGLPPVSAGLFAAAVQDEGHVTILRGENAGKTLAYFNVVRRMTRLATWSGAPLTARLLREDLLCPDCGFLAFLLQEDNGGPILGAARIRFTAAPRR